ncbi:uncharacterized protein LOC107012289 isoform X2 [Solanum pennellii]|uniref:Uncharacterized protein LOC107012289 isoform X2 n=1 Tax=Solanum pennellii TaxID=28526 RepID=A0ABM1G8V0_SOLPN|nr:uncharacterized protein LOC107012289 isoform X2 [Solanum pennellii]
MSVYIFLERLKVFIIVTWSSNKSQKILTLVFNFVNQKKKKGLLIRYLVWFRTLLWASESKSVERYLRNSEMDESNEELEPLFDYRRVQPFNTPFNAVCLDDDTPDSSPVISKKRKMIDSTKKDKNEAVQIIDCEEKEEDWLPPSPSISAHTSSLLEDSTIKEIRLKKKELASFAQSAKDELRDVEESVKRDLSASLHSLQDSVADIPSKPSKTSTDRVKMVISIQDKDGMKQFRVYADDKFERLFKSFADKVKLELQNLVFCFDGDKINPNATPSSLGMEDDDIIEVHEKPSC